MYTPISLNFYFPSTWMREIWLPPPMSPLLCNRERWVNGLFGTELSPDCNYSRIWELFEKFIGGFQSCHYSAVNFSKILGLFGAFWKKGKNSVLFWELLEPFGSMRKLFGGCFEPFCQCCFLCYFLKSSEFGRSPQFREQRTALVWKTPTSSKERKNPKSGFNTVILW